MNIWHDISPDRIMKDDFYAVIEISKGSKIKYELDKETGVLKLDRIIFQKCFSCLFLFGIKSFQTAQCFKQTFPATFNDYSIFAFICF